MTDYQALRRALSKLGMDFDECTLHDGNRCISLSASLTTLNWHFDYATGKFIGNHVWNKSESLGFDEDGNVICFCKKLGINT